MCNEVTPNPCQPTKAIVRLYRPAKVHTFCFHIKKLNPYVRCDTRGSGTLYNTSIGRYYLLDFNYRADHPNTDDKLYQIYTNDIELSQEHCRTFGSTSKIANLNYLIGNYLTFVFSLNRQFPKHIVNKYFKRLRQSLIEKFSAIRRRLDLNKNTNIISWKSTRTFIKFSFENHVIFIGFHLACGHNDCPRPAASVSNRDRWRCNRHHEAIVIEHPTNPLTSVKTSIKSTSMTINTAAPKHDPKFHCNKSTIGYKPQNARLQYSVTPETKINSKKRVTSEYRYFKEYSRLTFDIHRSPKQIERWKRLTTSVLRHEHNGISFKNKPFLLNEDKNNSKPYVVFKQIYHLPKRTHDNIGYIEQCENCANKKLFRSTKNWIRRVKKRNKLKKRLPPLPPDFNSDARLFYYNTYNLNLFNYKVRCHFDVSSLREYNYGYHKALELYKSFKDRSSRRITREEISPMMDSDMIINARDRAIINDSSTYFSRFYLPTPPHEIPRELLLQKSGNYLENFGLQTKRQLLELIIKYCKNIRLLDYCVFNDDINSLMSSLIENIKQNLNYLSINLSNYEDNEYSNIKPILQNLGQTLPSKLEYLSFVLEHQEDVNYVAIVPCIKEYIMKKKRVKYLAIKSTIFSNTKLYCMDLFDLKDEVKEFKLHNIEVLSYIKLFTDITDIYRFSNEID
ncbi:hypothetical protein RhiirB3_447318 [Rhizophagus irregularis]|nr:hypothetical protein RhiirB3_447318 [Rhizophagus irregularis]